MQLPPECDRMASTRSADGGVDGETVLNALLITGDPPGRRILVAVRRPDTNPRHPGVVSLPTMRIPTALGLLMAPWQALGPAGAADFSPVEGAGQPFGRPGAGRGLASFLAETLLSRKLGAADLLEAGRLRGRCALRLLSVAVVDDPTGTTRAELTRMYTLVIQVDAGGQLMPRESASYSEIRWVDRDLFRYAWRTRDAQLLFPDANPFEICIRGLCVISGVRLMDAMADLAVPAPDGYAE